MNIFHAILRAETEAAAERQRQHNDIISRLREITNMTSRTDAAIADLTAKVHHLESAADGAKALIATLVDEIRSGVGAAKEAGATDDQLQDLIDLADEADAKADDLTAAVVANTPVEDVVATPNSPPDTTTPEPTGNSTDMPIATPGDQPPVTVEPVTAAAGPASGTAGESTTDDGVLVTQPFAATAAAGPAASPQLADSSNAVTQPPPSEVEQPAVQTPSVVVGVEAASSPSNGVNQ